MDKFMFAKVMTDYALPVVLRRPRRRRLPRRRSASAINSPRWSQQRRWAVAAEPALRLKTATTWHRRERLHGERRHGYNRVGARSRREARRQDAEEAAKESVGVRIHRGIGRHEQGSHGRRVPGRHHRCSSPTANGYACRCATLGQIRRRRGDSRDANERVHERGRPAGARRKASQAVRERRTAATRSRGRSQVAAAVHGQPGGSAARPRQPPRTTSPLSASSATRSV